MGRDNDSKIYIVCGQPYTRDNIITHYREELHLDTRRLVFLTENNIRGLRGVLVHVYGIPSAKIRVRLNIESVAGNVTLVLQDITGED